MATLTTHFVVRQVPADSELDRTIIRRGHIYNQKRLQEIIDSIKTKTGFKVISVYLDATNYDCDTHRAELSNNRLACSCCWSKKIYG